MTTPVSTRREPELAGQTIVLIGGSAGIGLETARKARAEGASVVLTGRNPERLERAALDVDAQRTAVFDANDPGSLQSFFQDLLTPIDHVMVTAGAPHYGPPLEMAPEEARRGLSEHLLLRSTWHVPPPTKSGLLAPWYSWVAQALAALALGSQSRRRPLSLFPRSSPTSLWSSRRSAST